MPKSEARKKSSAAWDKDNMRTLGTRCRKEKADRIRARAEALGLSVSGYIMMLIDKDLGKNQKNTGDTYEKWLLKP